jgi:hypothetical protein
MDQLAHTLAKLTDDEREHLALRWADRTVRVHLPLVLRARGFDDEAALLEELPELLDVSSIQLAGARLARLEDQIPAEIVADGLIACVAATSGAVEGALRAARAAQSASSRHEPSDPPALASSPSGLPLGLRALADPEAARQLDEVLGMLSARSSHVFG